MNSNLPKLPDQIVTIDPVDNRKLKPWPVMAMTTTPTGALRPPAHKHFGIFVIGDTVQISEDGLTFVDFVPVGQFSFDDVSMPSPFYCRAKTSSGTFQFIWW